MSDNNWSIPAQDVFDVSPIIPVMVINKITDAVPLARALVAGGVKILEVTLRTPCALEAIDMIGRQVPDALIGAGTILNESQLRQAIDAGAQFVITPGATPELLKVATTAAVPLIPGVASISEAMTAMAFGYSHFKFFPAEASGGVKALKAFSGPLSDIRFCPTGGITVQSYQDYLALDNVDCVGGSWIAPTDVIERGDWAAITKLCRDAINNLKP